jgi:hypothetical protein
VCAGRTLPESAVSRRGEASAMKDLRAGRAPDASAMLGAKPMPRNDGREMALRRYCLNEWLDATNPFRRSARCAAVRLCLLCHGLGGLGTTSTDGSGPVEASTITSRYLLNDACGLGLGYWETLSFGFNLEKLTLNCSWKEGDDSTMQEDPQTARSYGIPKAVIERVAPMKKPASKDRLVQTERRFRLSFVQGVRSLGRCPRLPQRSTFPFA